MTKKEDSKEGFSVRIAFECFGPDGELWSETENQWYGMTNEKTMNDMTLGCINAITEFVSGMNNIKYGDGSEI